MRLEIRLLAYCQCGGAIGEKDAVLEAWQDLELECEEFAKEVKCGECSEMGIVRVRPGMDKLMYYFERKELQGG